MSIREQLSQLAASTQVSPYTQGLAKEYLERLDDLASFLDPSGYSVSLIGQQGVGKSSLLAVLSGLIIGSRPQNPDEMTARYVPAVRAGGTTVCEVRVRPTSAPACPAPPGADYGVVIEPRSVDEVDREIAIFASTELRRRKDEADHAQTDGDIQAGEITRAIRGLTGCTLVQRRDNNGRFVGMDDPLDELIQKVDSNEHRFAHILKQTAKLSDRTKTAWWFHGPRDTALTEVKELFWRLNNGLEPSATLPVQITIWAKPANHQEFAGLDLNFVDTRGFDGNLEARGDLQSVLRDPRSVVLLCTRFTDHANDTVRQFLRDVERLRFLNVTTDRLRLVIIDKDESRNQAAADADREVGQFIKKDACTSTLVANGLGSFVQAREGFPDFVTVFDSIHSDPGVLFGLIRSTLDAIRESKQRELERSEANATTFLANIHNEVQTSARMRIDRRLAQVFEAARPASAFLPHCIEGIVDLVESNRRFASRIAAMCRRSGEYDTLNAYDAVHTFVQQSFDAYVTPLDNTMQATFRAVELDSDFSDVVDHVREKREVYERRKAALRAQFAAEVRGAVRDEMRQSDVWRRSADRWGRGKGFLDDVVSNFQTWAGSNEANFPSREPLRAQDFGLVHEGN